MKPFLGTFQKPNRSIHYFLISLFAVMAGLVLTATYFFSSSAERSLGLVYETQAQSIGDSIADQFFERYGDSQAFALGIHSLMDGKAEKDRITALLNQYVALYRIYELIIVTDPSGKWLASNTTDATGAAVPSFRLEGTSFAGNTWFQRAREGTSTRDVEHRLSGTSFEVFAEDPSVDQVFSNSHRTLGFTSLIFGKGERVLGTVSLRIPEDWLEKLLADYQTRMSAYGPEHPMISILDAQDRPITASGKFETPADENRPSDGILIRHAIASAKFPSALGWKVQVHVPASDFSRWLKVRKATIGGIALLFLVLGVLVVLYFGAQFEDLFRKYNEAISVQARLEDVVRDRTKDLENTIERLGRTQKALVAQEKMAALGMMASGVAHEIRNPLNIIVNSATALREFRFSNHEEPLNDRESADLCSMIERHSARIDDIVRTILQNVRKDVDARKILDVNEITSSVIAMNREMLRIKYHLPIGISLQSTGGPIHAKMFAEDIRRILSNLLDNAAYSVTKRWGAKVQEKGEIRVELASRGPTFFLSVFDNGLGFAEDKKRFAFTPFFTTKPPGDGTGLGLSLIADLVRENGGSIDLDSKEGEFCRFKIELPAFEPLKETRETTV